MLAALITISPRDPASGGRVDVRLSSVNDRLVTGLGATPWEPAITVQPQIGLQRFNGDFTDGIEPGRVNFGFNLGIARRRFPIVTSALWAGAPVEIRLGAVGAEWGKWPVVFRGLVGDYGNDYPAMTLTAAVDTEPFLADVLSKTYAGTGDIEGSADLKNRLKPLALGRPRNVEPVPIDLITGVYQFSAYGPIEGVETLYERASAFPAPIADYPTYAALVAAAIPPGRWATCNAFGLIRLGAPAAGVITGDIRGHAVGGVAPRAAGALSRLVAQLVGVANDRIDPVALDSLDDEGATFSDEFLTEQASVIELVRRLVLPCNWHPLVNNLGVLTAAKPNLAASPKFTLHAQGKALPAVQSATEQSVSPPYAKTIMAAELNWRKQNFDEISFEVPLVDRGAYDAVTIYREGNIVTLPDGSQWLYINTTPSAGHAPPVGTPGDAWWKNMRGPTKAEDIKYGDGKTIEDLKPTDPGATHGAPDGTPVGNTTAELVVARIAAAEGAITAIDELADGIVGDVSGLQQSVGHLLTDVGGLADRVLASEGEIVTITTLQETQGAAIEQVKTTASTQAGDLAQLDTRLTAGEEDIAEASERITAVVGDNQALAERATALEVEVSGPGGLKGELQTTKARIEEVDQAAADATLAVAQRASTLEAEVEDLDTGLSAASARIGEVETAAADATTAVAQRTTLLEASVESLDDGLGSTNARIGEVELAAATATGAVAQRTSDLEATIDGPGGLSARVTSTEETAVDALTRTAGALYQQTVSAGGGRTQMTMYAYDQDGNVVTGIDFIGDNFTFRGDVFVDGTIHTKSIAENAMSDGDKVALASPLTGNNNWRTAVSYTLDIPADFTEWKVQANVSGSQGFPSGSGTWNIRLMADGVRVSGAGGEKAEDSFALSGLEKWGPGQHTFTVEWRAGSNVSLAECNMNLVWFKR